MHAVKRVKYIEDYKLMLTFENNESKIVNLRSYLNKGIFLELRDVAYFRRVRIAGSTIVWPNEADFCPDVLYDIGKRFSS
jgi:hypothetical protein